MQVWIEYKEGLNNCSYPMFMICFAYAAGG